MTDFDDHPVNVHHVGGFIRVYSSVDSVLKPLVINYMRFLSTKDDLLLRQYGDSTQLKDAIKKLYLVSTTDYIEE